MLSRVVSIWTLVVLFLVICSCIALLFFVHQKKNYPFLISVDPLTAEWTVVTYPGKDSQKVVNQYQIVQEKLVNDYVKNWFTISDDEDVNNERWQECDAEECNYSEQYNPENTECALFCASDIKLFEQFSTKVYPEYKARVQQASETWTVEKLDITPTAVTEESGLWQVYANIHSSINGYFDVLIFVTVARSTNSHHSTLGYYIYDFNSYRMVK